MVGECEGEGRNGGESLCLPLTNKRDRRRREIYAGNLNGRN